MALTATTQILIAFCKQEILGDMTELAQFLCDLDDDDCPIKFADKSKIEKLELKYEKLSMEEPDQYLNYDAYLEWYDQCLELEAEIERLNKKAASELLGVNEWWLCTKNLGEKLQEHGEIVIFHTDFAFWGRQNFGFDPAYDEVIKKIATDIEIWPGMSHDWSKLIKIEQ